MVQDNARLEARLSAVEAKIIGHEILCTERWNEVRRRIEEMSGLLRTVAQFQEQQLGALKGAKWFYATLGAIVTALLAAGGMVLKIFPALR